MSRVAKSPISLPKGVDVGLESGSVKVKGPKGAAQMALDPRIAVTRDGETVSISPAPGNEDVWAMAGTTRALINNMVVGVTSGFQKKLELVGVGYRAQAQGRKLSLSLGFSHPIDFAVPEGIDVATPSATEILISGVEKQRVGQVAAVIRGLRPPEPYKGKGIRYAGEAIIRKESKKTKKK